MDMNATWHVELISTDKKKGSVSVQSVTETGAKAEALKIFGSKHWVADKATCTHDPIKNQINNGRKNRP